MINLQAHTNDLQSVAYYLVLRWTLQILSFNFHLKLHPFFLPYPMLLVPKFPNFNLLPTPHPPSKISLILPCFSPSQSTTTNPPFMQTIATPPLMDIIILVGEV